MIQKSVSVTVILLFLSLLGCGGSDSSSLLGGGEEIPSVIGEPSLPEPSFSGDSLQVTTLADGSKKVWIPFSFFGDSAEVTTEESGEKKIQMSLTGGEVEQAISQAVSAKSLSKTISKTVETIPNPDGSLDVKFSILVPLVCEVKEKGIECPTGVLLVALGLSMTLEVTEEGVKYRGEVVASIGTTVAKKGQGVATRAITENWKHLEWVEKLIEKRNGERDKEKAKEKEKSEDKKPEGKEDKKENKKEDKIEEVLEDEGVEGQEEVEEEEEAEEEFAVVRIRVAIDAGIWLRFVDPTTPDDTLLMIGCALLKEENWGGDKPPAGFQIRELTLSELRTSPLQECLLPLVTENIYTVVGFAAEEGTSPFFPTAGQPLAFALGPDVQKLRVEEIDLTDFPMILIPVPVGGFLTGGGKGGDGLDGGASGSCEGDWVTSTDFCTAILDACDVSACTALFGESEENCEAILSSEFDCASFIEEIYGSEFCSSSGSLENFSCEML